MKLKFQLTINSIKVVNELPGTWSGKDCLALLKQLEFEDVSSIPEEHLREYAVLALQDLETDEAAAALLEFVFGEKLSSGKKQNLSEEMSQDRCWEEYPDLSCHERIFNAQVLLHQAFPETPQPEINQVEAILGTLNQEAETYLQKLVSKASSQSIPEALIVRCLASALPANSILNRLFEDQIKGAPFAEAVHLLWHIHSQALPPESGGGQYYQLSLFSPKRWTGELEDELVLECEPFVEELSG